MTLLPHEKPSGPVVPVSREPYEPGQQLFRAVTYGGRVTYEGYTVVRTTPKGAWIATSFEYREKERKREGLHELHQLALIAKEKWSWEKWIGLSSRFVQRGLDEALCSLKRRNTAYIRHCNRRLDNAKKAREAINKHLGLTESKGESHVF